MRFEVVNVTPEMAARFLSKNEGNRKLREQHAASLARAITEGRYKLTHQAAAITKRGRLIDGQHRFRAICLANRAAQMVIAFDVPDDTFAVLDSGMPRRMHERLRSNPQHTSICTSMYRLMVRMGRAQEWEIQMMLDVLTPAMQKWSAIPRHGPKRGLRVSHVSAIVLRLAMHLAREEADAVARIQWLVEKLFRDDLTGAPPVLWSFHRQVSEGVANLDIAVSSETDQFCRAWVAFDPQNESTTRLQINDHSQHIKDARFEFKFVSQGVFD